MKNSIKKNAALLCYFILLSSGLFAQDEKSDFRKFGIGASFQPFGLVNILEEIEGVPITKINFAFNATKNFRAELDFGFFHYKDKTYEETVNAITVGLGLLYTKRIDANVIMGGVKFDYTNGKDNWENDFGEEYEDTFNRFAIGPVCEYEHLFGGRFGIGAELGLKFSNVVFQYEDDFMEEEDEEEASSIYTDAAFFARFYF